MSPPRFTLVFAARGGVGRSVMAANLAIIFAKKLRQPAVLLDLDWQSGGSLASALDLDPPPGNWALALEPARDLTSLLAVHGSGVKLLAAPAAGSSPPPTPRQMVKLVADLARHGTQLVVDTTVPNMASEIAVALFDLASPVILPVIPDIPALGATRALLEQIRNNHYPMERVHVVLNRSGVTDDINPDDLVEHLGRPLLATIPFSPAIISSVNRGVPLAAGGGGSTAATALTAIAQKIAQMPTVNLAQVGQAILSKSSSTPPVVTPPAGGPSPTPPAGGESTSLAAGALIESRFPDPEVSPPSGGVVALVPIARAADTRLLEFRQQIHRQLVEDMKRQNIALERLRDPQYKREVREQVERAVIGIVERMRDLPATSREQRAKLVKDVTDEAIGYGPLETYLADPSVTEIMVNGPQMIYIERSGRLVQVPDAFTDETQLRVVIDRIVAPLGRRVDESSPMCDARLPDGSRVNVIIPPLALRGSTITIRKFPMSRLTMDNLVGYGSLTPEMAHFIRCCVLARLNIFISGGTGSGKTTLLNVLSSFIPVSERIVTIEDAAELQLIQPHVIPLEARPPNLEGSGAVHIRDLVRNSLRMRPDRIVVGEIRGGEALDMLQAMNTGHDGSLSTGHANSPRDALSRIETMVLMAGMDLPVRAIREQIASALHVIVQVTRLRDGSRKITKITEITGMESDVITMQDLYHYDQTGVDPDGRVMGAFRTAGLRPQFAEAFERAGLSLDMAV
jgi:Flp pilus assembly CpaF family ATPase/MinD-like ATPase involved in chromosome partitioning or flagellar assembly